MTSTVVLTRRVVSHPAVDTRTVRTRPLLPTPELERRLEAHLLIARTLSR